MSAGRANGRGAGKPFGLSVRALVHDPTGHRLILRRSERCRVNPGRWEMPGGKVLPGETFDGSLRRHVTEETFLEVSLGFVVGADDSEMPEVQVAHLFMEAALASRGVTLSGAHDAYAWVCPAEFPDIDFCPELVPFARAYARAAG